MNKKELNQIRLNCLAARNGGGVDVVININILMRLLDHIVDLEQMNMQLRGAGALANSEGSESLSKKEVDLLDHILVATEAELASNPPSGRASDRELSIQVFANILKRSLGRTTT